MASENKKAESLCKNMSGLCGASCAFLLLEPDIKLSCVGEDWLCSRYCGCDYCNTLHYGCSEAYRWNGKYVFYCPKGLVFIAASVADEQGSLSGGMVLGPVVMGEPDDTIGMFENADFCKSVSELPVWDTAKVRYAEEILSAVAASVSVLLSRRAMEYSDEIAGKAVTLELSTSEFFMDNYVEHMMFM